MCRNQLLSDTRKHDWTDSQSDYQYTIIPESQPEIIMDLSIRNDE